MKIGIVSLGCSKTLVDTENLLGTLGESVTLVSENEAEIVLLNTCSFLKSARDEVEENLEILKDKKVILLGCYTKFADSEILDKFPQVWAVVPFTKYREIGEILTSVKNGKKVYFDFEVESDYLEMPKRQLLTLPHLAYLKISEGCDNSCSYCTIPQIRGKFRSRTIEHILAEAKNLISSGVKELVLTSQDTGYYGKDLYGKAKFTELLFQIASLEGDFWIRFLYLYPERIKDDLLDLISENKKILPYFDIPFQHSSKEILIKMKRPFLKERNLELLEKIRNKLPEAVIRTTFIVGFPSETESDFLELKDFVEKAKFERVGVFVYSNEKGAESYTFPNQIEEKVKKERQAGLYNLAEKISRERNKEQFGKTFQVLVEGYSDSVDLFFGRSFREAPEVDPLIYFPGENLKIGEFVKVKITEFDEFNLFGEII